MYLQFVVRKRNDWLNENEIISVFFYSSYYLSGRFMPPAAMASHRAHICAGDEGGSGAITTDDGSNRTWGCHRCHHSSDGRPATGASTPLMHKFFRRGRVYKTGLKPRF